MSEHSTESENTSKPEPEVYKNKVHVNLSFVAAIAALIVLASILASIGYFMYWNDPNRKYDIARPGDADTAQTESVEDTTPTDTTSPVDAPAVQQKNDFLTKEMNALRGMNNFDAADLSDQNLQLTPSDQPSF